MRAIRALTIILLVPWLLVQAAAAQSAREYFEPIVSHQQFTMLIRNIDMTRDQRTIVEMLFMDYTDAIERLAVEADQRADQAGRQRVADALTGRAIIDPTELRRLRIAVLEVYEPYFGTIDHEFEKLTTGIESVLLDEQRQALAPEIRALRRAVLLHPRHNERTFHEYAGDGVDVQLLVEEAMQGGELEGLDPGAIDRILEQYEHDLDRLLIETSSEYRRSRMNLRKARVSRDARALQAAEQKAISLWERLYKLNEATVRQIGDVAAAHLGAEARDRWLHRFHRSCFEWMFSRQGPDRQYEWLMRQRLSEQQRQHVQAIYDEYLPQRFILASKAITLMIRARSELGSIIYSMMDPSDLSGQRRNIYDDLLRNSGELATLDAATSNAFEDLLDANQRRTFRDAFRRR